MTLETLVRRFLKDNGIYYPLVKQYKSFSSKDVVGRNFVNCIEFKKWGIKRGFYILFKYNPMFSGNHTSSKRRYFYKLNKKWKNFVDGKCFVEHNLMVGDYVFFPNVFGVLRIGKILHIENNIVTVKDVNYGYERKVHLLSIKLVNNEKNRIINLFYKDNNGNCYGKINGSNDEVQLQ